MQLDSIPWKKGIREIGEQNLSYYLRWKAPIMLKIEIPFDETIYRKMSEVHLKFQTKKFIKKMWRRGIIGGVVTLVSLIGLFSVGEDKFVFDIFKYSLFGGATILLTIKFMEDALHKNKNNFQKQINDLSKRYNEEKFVRSIELGDTEFSFESIDRKLSSKWTAIKSFSEFEDILFAEILEETMFFPIAKIEIGDENYSKAKEILKSRIPMRITSPQ